MQADALTWVPAGGFRWSPLTGWLGACELEKR
jgi:hypothetical protein